LTNFFSNNLPDLFYPAFSQANNRVDTNQPNLSAQ